MNIKKHQQKFPTTIYSLEIELIKKYNYNWAKISQHEYLTEDFIDKYCDKVDWWWISAIQILSSEFIEKYYKRVHWYNICKYQKVSIDLLIKYNVNF